MNEAKRVQSVNLSQDKKPSKIIKIGFDRYAVIQAIKAAEPLDMVDIPYLMDTTKLPYSKLQSAIDRLIRDRVIMRRDGEYHLSAFPRGVIIYTNKLQRELDKK